MVAGVPLFTATGICQKVCYMATTRKQRIRTRSYDPPPPTSPPTQFPQPSKTIPLARSVQATCERRGDSPHSNYSWVVFPKYSCVEALTHSVTPWTFKKVIKIDNNSETIIQRDWHRFKKREICRGYTGTERRPTEGSWEGE